jgi:hypothetical protein
MKRPQFSLRLLLMAVACIAVALGILRLLRTKDAPTVSLSSEIARFNVEAHDNKVGVLEPQLTEAEVLSAIQAELTNLNSHLNGQPSIKMIYEKILATRQLPAGSSLMFMDSWERLNVPKQYVWWINLNVETEKGHGYGLRIRQTINPVYGQNQSSS